MPSFVSSGWAKRLGDGHSGGLRVRSLSREWSRWTGDVQLCRGGGRAGPRIEPAQVNGDLVPHQIPKDAAHEKTPHREDAGLRKYSGDNLLSHLAALSSALAA